MKSISFKNTINVKGKEVRETGEKNVGHNYSTTQRML